MTLEEVELGVPSLKPQFWTDNGENWVLRFVRMACEKADGSSYEYAFVPIFVTDYLVAPTEWVQASGTGGKQISYELALLRSRYY